jgi:hypothetical protein
VIELGLGAYAPLPGVVLDASGAAALPIPVPRVQQLAGATLLVQGFAQPGGVVLDLVRRPWSASRPEPRASAP